ncbi:hypothetical protein STRIP9103_05740 [Streptomyces ipomoeae 91-03]|uniref:Uncharacterized protein n=1 Tax=Streptomyces ipomoeae 91-03 TaxID=698759 RepID=L1L934_9ACTN|nr:hypothetical protein STRIP9103_05740 [Streptomyces ipomoeae 91-03]
MKRTAFARPFLRDCQVGGGDSDRHTRVHPRAVPPSAHDHNTPHTQTDHEPDRSSTDQRPALE